MLIDFALVLFSCCWRMPVGLRSIVIVSALVDREDEEDTLYTQLFVQSLFYLAGRHVIVSLRGSLHGEDEAHCTCTGSPSLP
jgi:hypothetical protein